MTYKQLKLTNRQIKGVIAYFSIKEFDTLFRTQGIYQDGGIIRII